MATAMRSSSSIAINPNSGQLRMFRSSLNSREDKPGRKDSLSKISAINLSEGKSGKKCEKASLDSSLVPKDVIILSARND